MTKKRVIAVAIISATLIILAFAVSNVHRTHEQRLLNDAFRPCDVANKDKSRPHFFDDIPCYQAALRIEPKNEFFKTQLAHQLTYAGRFDEARPLYQQLAAVPGPFQASAQRWLEPGMMQKMRDGVIQSRQILHDLQVVTTKDSQEEKAFLAQHAVVQNGTIVSMAEPYKTQWLQMREQHTKEQQALNSRL